MPAEFPDTPAGWVRRMLSDWLAAAESRPQQLADWLQGYDMPAVGHDDEPYVWLLRALPMGGDRFTIKKQFAQRVALVLAGKPDVERPGWRPEQVLYNLFMLCAGLESPDELWPGLYDIYARAANEGTLQGEWLGVSLGTALCSALICNQRDNTLKEVWLAILQGQADPVFGDNEHAALDGVRLMPKSIAEQGQPDLDAIGTALKHTAARLESADDRYAGFQSVLHKIISTSPGRPTWYEDLLLQARTKEWPDWAGLCLALRLGKWTLRKWTLSEIARSDLFDRVSQVPFPAEQAEDWTATEGSGMTLEDALKSDSETGPQLKRIESLFGSWGEALKTAVALLDLVIEQRKKGYDHLLLADPAREEVVEVELGRSGALAAVRAPKEKVFKPRLRHASTQQSRAREK